MLVPELPGSVPAPSVLFPLYCFWNSRDMLTVISLLDLPLKSRVCLFVPVCIPSTFIEFPDRVGTLAI